MFLQIIKQSIILRETGLLQNSISIKLFVSKVGNYCFLKLMSNNRMSIKENTLQLPPQFHSTSASKSTSETKKNLIKIGKYIMYNKNIQTDFMRAIMILSSHFYLWKLKYNKDSTIAWPRRFTFPCMSSRLFFLL